MATFTSSNRVSLKFPIERALAKKDSVICRDANIPSSLVHEIEIIPPNPKPGDQIKIKIKGACDERVPVEICYEQTVPVVANTVMVQINNVQVHWPKNRLFIEAKSVSTMNVAAKFLLWIYKKVEVVNGVAQHTLRDMPKGAYSVKMNGTVLQGTSCVSIKITAFSELHLDEAGSYVYTFHPNPERGGNLAVRCNQIVKYVEIKPPE